MYMSMLVLASTAFLISIKGGFINIGIEGQLHLGAILAYTTSILIGERLSSFLTIFTAFVASVAGGILWIIIPLILRIMLKVNEVFVTMILNFIAPLIVSWMVTGPFRDPRMAHPQSIPIPVLAQLPLIPGTRLHVGVLLSFVVCIFTWFLLQKTTWGTYIKAVGSSPVAARAMGIDVEKTTVMVSLLSASIASLAGFIEINGNSHVLMERFSIGWGYLGIAVAILGNLNPFGVLLASFFYAMLISGGRGLEIKLGVPIEIAFILQVAMVLAVVIARSWFSEKVSTP
ncbi:MAG: ABC transporter permease [Thermoproteota archaeon]